MIVENKVEPMLTLPKSRMPKDRVFLVLNILFSVVAAAALGGGFWWFRTVRWGAETWSDMKLQELVYTLLMPMEGTNTEMLMDHIRICVVPAVILAAAAAVLIIIFFRRKTILHIIQIAAILIGVSFAVVGFASAWEVLDLSGYIEGQEEYSTFIDENYIDPNKVALEFPEQKRNLIYIFLESMENTFADEASGGAFEKNVIPELTQISLENQNFSGGQDKLNGGHVMTGASWTVGAMFSQTSGLPLLIPISNNAMDLQTDFFSGVSTLGDILEEAGYRQMLDIGSDAEFGGRRLLFTQHGNYDIHDYYYFKDRGLVPDDYFVWWGFEDMYLFEAAKKDLTDLAASDEPFNFTLLTVDTHFEDGYVCSLCKDDYSTQYSNVYACSSAQVSEFIDWIKEQPFYENTTIILAGDHLTMDKDYCADVSNNYERTTYFTIINPAVTPENDIEREYTTFDCFPTTLAALGVTIPGNRLGLGTNLFSAEQTIYEKYGEYLFEQGLNSRSELMEMLTEGIETGFATMKVDNYDKDTQTVEVRAVDIQLPKGSEGLTCFVWPSGDEENKKQYDGEETKDGEYRFVITMKDFPADQGKFNVALYSVKAQGKTFITSTTMNIGDKDTLDGVYFDNIEPTLIIENYDYATGKLLIRFENAPADVVSLNLAVWHNPDQSDMKWYEMSQNEEGEYSLTLDISDLGLLGVNYNFHLYGILVNGDSNIMDIESCQIG